MIKKPDLTDKATDQRNNPDAVVFAGDGEPQIPQSMVTRITGLLQSDKLQPDTYSIGGSVEMLETRIAKELGMEAAIWMPTGTLANQIALRHHCGTKSRIVLQEQSHIYHDEGDALVKLSGLNAIPLAYGQPYFSVDELRKALKEATSGRVLNPVGAVSIESPVRRQAGQVVPWNEMLSITNLCHEEGIPIHLDAARLYMMSAATGIDVKKYKLLAFILSAMFAGAAGAVYAHLPPGYIHPNNYTVIEMVTFLAMVVFGGLGHIWGGIIGAVIITIVYDLTRPLYEYQLFIFGLTIVLTILFMPKGIGGFIDKYFIDRRFKKKQAEASK